MSEKKEFLKWTLVVVVAFVIVVIVGTVTGAFGRWFGMRVERAVMVESHQYREARSSELATYEAQLAELEGRLAREDLSASQIAEINAQIRSINVLMRSARTR